MRTITIDIINDKAINFLRDLELLQLIRMRKEKSLHEKASSWVVKYKGAMTKQSLSEVDSQLNNLRSAWE